MVILILIGEFALIFDISCWLVDFVDRVLEIDGVNLVEDICKHVNRLIDVLVLLWHQSIWHPRVINVWQLVINKWMEIISTHIWPFSYWRQRTSRCSSFRTRSTHLTNLPSRGLFNNNLINLDFYVTLMRFFTFRRSNTCSITGLVPCSTAWSTLLTFYGLKFISGIL